VYVIIKMQQFVMYTVVIVIEIMIIIKMYLSLRISFSLAKVYLCILYSRKNSVNTQKGIFYRV